jgi:hypothetical protein
VTAAYVNRFVLKKWKNYLGVIPCSRTEQFTLTSKGDRRIMATHEAVTSDSAMRGSACADVVLSYDVLRWSSIVILPGADTEHAYELAVLPILGGLFIREHRHSSAC